jgi:hypothetical protein
MQNKVKAKIVFEKDFSWIMDGLIVEIKPKINLSKSQKTG